MIYSTLINHQISVLWWKFNGHASPRSSHYRHMDRQNPMSVRDRNRWIRVWARRLEARIENDSVSPAMTLFKLFDVAFKYGRETLLVIDI